MSVISYKKICPKCGAHPLDQRIPRGHLVKLFFFWLPLKRYLCTKCFRKTYFLYAR